MQQTAPKRSRAKPLSPDERRAAITAATVPLVRQFGTDVTTRQIADAAGIAEGTIFRVFADKDALLRAAIEDALDPADTEAALDGINPDLPLQIRLTMAIMIVQERMRDVLHLAALVGRHRLAATEESRRARYSRASEHLTAIFEPDRDHLRCKPEDAARYLQMLAFSSAHPRLTGGPEDPPDVLASLLLNGIRRSDSSGPPL